MQKILNIGVLGCANIAKRSVVPAILELQDHLKLAGIASRTLDRAQEFASEFSTSAFDCYQRLLDQPELDAVYVPLPNSLHFEWVEKALLKGLHVLVEKSLACDYEDVKHLNSIAKEKKLALVENFQFRFHSQLQSVLDLISDGTIGELRCFRSSFGFPGLPEPNDIRYQKALGGGALLDTGAYPLKIAQIIMGHDIEVKAASLNFTQDKEVDIWGGAYLKQKNGTMFGETAFGFNHQYQCNLELWGSKGKLSTGRIFTAPPSHVPIIELETQSAKEMISLQPDHHFKNMLVYFCNLIRSGDPQKLDKEYKQNVNQARLIDESKLKANE